MKRGLVAEYLWKAVGGAWVVMGIAAFPLSLLAMLGIAGPSSQFEGGVAGALVYAGAVLAYPGLCALAGVLVVRNAKAMSIGTAALLLMPASSSALVLLVDKQHDAVKTLQFFWGLSSMIPAAFF